MDYYLMGPDKSRKGSLRSSIKLLSIAVVLWTGVSLYSVVYSLYLLTIIPLYSHLEGRRPLTQTATRQSTKLCTCFK